MIGLDAFGGSGRTINTQPAAQPGFFSRLGDLAGNVGNTLLTGLESAVPSVLNRAIFGGSRPQSASQGPALTTITNVGAQESQGSGTIEAVSYTHLRAHETVLDLVCRLLLEKKKKK